MNNYELIANNANLTENNELFKYIHCVPAFQCDKIVESKK